VELSKIIRLRPYLYHLTSVSNELAILQNRRLLSTEYLVKQSDLAPEDQEKLLTTRRTDHEKITANGQVTWIRDQRPLNKALDRCLTHGWTREDYIKLLNSKVFMWPTLKRLKIHFGRYKSENPVIFRFKTNDVINLNLNRVRLSHLNSGATRPIPKYRGAPPRGPETFKLISDFNLEISKIAEVTFDDYCVLPSQFEKGTSPNGPWTKV